MRVVDGDRQPDPIRQLHDDVSQRRVEHHRPRAHLVVAELLDIIIEPAPDAVGGVAHPGVARQAGGGVAVGGEVLGQRGRRPGVGMVDACAVLVRPEPREHGDVRGQGPGSGRTRPVERDPLPGPVLEHGRRLPRIPMQAHVVGAHGVHDDPEQVRGGGGGPTTEPAPPRGRRGPTAGTSRPRSPQSARAPTQRAARCQPGVGRTTKRRIRVPAPNASASAAAACRRRTARSGPRNSSVPRTMPAHVHAQEAERDAPGRPLRQAEKAIAGGTRISVRPTVTRVSATGTIQATCRLIRSVLRPT